jgi:hypothetical protein
VERKYRWRRREEMAKEFKGRIGSINWHILDPSLRSNF